MRKILTLLTLFSFLTTCKEVVIETNVTPDQIVNPFENIDYNPEEGTEEPIDSCSFLGLHKYVFSKSCNQPGCHDGTFEPDFRTVSSAYNGLVLHPVKKNYEVDPLPYRVKPGDPEMSMMWKRITEHNPPNFELMPSSGEILPESVINNIKKWIENGAVDIFGNDPMPESPRPNCYGLLAFLPDLANYRVDSIRGGNGYSAFPVLADQTVKIWFTFLDQGPYLDDYIFGQNLEYNKVKLSYDRFNFNDAVEFTLNLSHNPLTMNAAFSNYNPTNMEYYHSFSFKPQDYGFALNDVIYIRTYVQDADHDLPFESPEDPSNYFLKSYFSFIVVE